MKQKLLNSLRLRACMLVAVLCAGVSAVWGESGSIEINTTNSGVTGSYQDKEFDVNDITFKFTQWMKSTNIQAKKSTTNSCYNIDAIPGTITSIVVEQTGTARAIKIYGGTSEKPTEQITSPATAATMTFDFTGKNYNYFSLTTPGNACYFDKITINYTTGGSATETCAIPTFSLAENYYKGTQSVTISCATEGATIYYTTDGATPTTSSTQGTTVSISETSTLKAIAVKEGYNNSSLASATYAIVAHEGTDAEPFTVADARNILTAFPSKTFDDVCVSGIISQIDSYSSKYNSITYWISDDGTTTDQFEVYSGKGLNGADFSSKDDLIVGSTVVVKGKIKKYNSTFEFDVNSVIVSMEAVSTPIINAIAPDPLEYNATSGEIAYTITNPATGDVSLTASTTADWISDITVGERTVTFSTTRNEGTENRTATINLAYTGAEPVSVTITQKYYVADSATLPFSFDGGKSNIENTVGLTQSGLGSDYNSSPKLKFTETGNWVVLHFDERPGTLTYDIKGNSFSGGIFTVQTSADGNTWNQLTKYEAFGSNIKSEEFNNLASDVRYIRWIYTKKSSGNVALGNISLAAYVAPQTYTLTIPSTDNVNISAAYDIEGIINEGEVAEIEQGTEIILTVDVDEGYDLQSLTVIGGETPFAPRPDSEDSYKFTMPAYNATVNAKVVEHVEPATATYTLATRITSGKHYVIASGTEGSVKVMGNQGGNNRPAAAASIRDGVLSVSDEYEFIIESATIDEAIGYSIYDAGVPGYLYAASSSSNYLKTQATNNANGIWKIEINSEGIASVVAQGSNTHNNLRFNKQSSLFSCYVSGQEDVYLFEKVETPVITLSDVNSDDLPEAANNANVTLTRKFVNKWNPICLPFDVTDLSVFGEGYEVVKYTGDADNNGNVSLKFETVTDKMDANVPYMVWVNEDADVNESWVLTFNGVNYNPSNNPVSAGTNYNYVGVYKNYAKGTSPIVTGDVILSGGAYKTVTGNGGNAIKGFRGYWKKSATAGEAKSITAIINGQETDDIKYIELVETLTDGIYNLQGQKVNHAQKGVYIVNGKKVVIK